MGGIHQFNTIQARLFYHLKVQGVFRDPFIISGTIKASQMKLCTIIALLKAYQNTKKIFRSITYDVTMTSLLKQWENQDLRETRQIICDSTGNDESFPKMLFLLKVSD